MPNSIDNENPIGMIRNYFFTILSLNTKTVENDKISSLTMKRKCIKDHSFIMYAKFSEKITFLTPRYAHVREHITG